MQRRKTPGGSLGTGKQKTLEQLRSALPSLSLTQLAERWNCKISDVEDCIRTGVLRADVLLYDAVGGSGSWVLVLNGHYRLPVKWAARLLDGPVRRGDYFEVELNESDTLARTVRRAGAVRDLDNVEPGQFALLMNARVTRPRLGTGALRPFALSRRDMRIRREEVERFQALAGGSKRKTEGTNAKTPLQRMLSAVAKRARSDERERRAPVHNAVRAEFKRLRAEGFARTKAVFAIVSNGPVRQRIEDVAQKTGVKPWRGDFYSVAAVLKIVPR